MKLKKGSAKAKKFMAHMRSLRKKNNLSGWKKGTTQFREVGESTRKGDIVVKRRKHTSLKQRDLGKQGSFLNMKTITGNRKIIKKRLGSVTSDNAKQLILNSIDASDYGETLNTPDQKIRFVEKTFLSEYGWAIARMGKQRAIEEWLRGLPSVVTLPFYNVDILNLAIQWGALKPNATERQEDKILANYWKLMASQLLQMMNKRKLNKKFY